MNRLVLFAALFAAASLAVAESRIEQLDRAYATVVAAQRALDEAKLRRDRGVEPAPGERVAIARGGSRLRDDYFERQQELEREVALAHWQLDQALARWNALR
ncbi:MAG: hypothetical protein ACREUO_01740 [Burkholderiales bacterium]